MVAKGRQAKYKGEPKPPRRLTLWLRHAGLGGLALLLLAGLGLGSHSVLDPAVFPVKTVQVRGELNRIQNDHLQQVIAPRTAAGFLWLDVAALKREVESLPWVQSATVRRQWPDTLEVLVQQQTALARWGGQALVNARGEAFAPEANSFPLGLPQLEGPEGMSHAVVVRYLELSAELVPLGLQVDRLAMDERHAWTVDLDNGIRVLLGRDADGVRLQRFIRSYTGVLAGRIDDMWQVDLRYTNGLAVKWKKQARPVG